MPLRNVATTFTIEQQRLEINALAGDVNNIATGVTAVANATTAVNATNATTAATANALAASATGADLTLSGTLTVNGSQTILNTATLEVEDKNIIIAKGSTTDAAASGGGITLKGANDKTISYNQTGDKWVSNKDFEVPQLIATQGATTEFIQATSTNNGTRSIGSFEGKDSSGNAVTLKLGGYGDTQRGEIFTHSNHALGFATNNAATQMVLSTDGKLGLGTVTPNRDLEVYKDAAQASIGIIASTTGQSSLWLGNTGDINVGGIYYEHSNNALGFRVNDAERLRITDNGLSVNANHDIRFENGTWSGEVAGKIQQNSDWLYVQGGTSGIKFRSSAGSNTLECDSSGNASFTGTVSDGRGNLRRISPVNPVGVYDVVAGDNGTQGRYVFTTDNVRLVGGMTSGDVITIINNGGSDITIDAATNSVTLTNSADASTGDRTLASKGMATVLYVGSATAFISGAGLS